MDARYYFEGKRVTVMGLGLLGRGVGDVEFLADMGADVIVTDLQDADHLAPSLARLAGYPNITYVLGKHRLEDFRNRDLILKSAGVPLHSRYIDEAKRRRIPIRMSADLFAELSGATIVGITGTRGKTTTTCLLYKILRATGREVVLGGNIHGVSTLALLPKVTADTVAVLELDAWQLRGFRSIETSPSVAIFTTFYPDHLRYYGNSLPDYFADKQVIYEYQSPGDTLVVGEQAYPYINAAAPLVAARALVADGSLVREWPRELVGEHNVDNIACAVTAARALGVPDAMSRAVVASFTPVAGRLEKTYDKNGIIIYNDAAAIIPEATIAAIRALSSSSLILIIGGGEKGTSIDELVSCIRSSTERIVLLAGTGTERIRPYFPDAPVCQSLVEALDTAYALATVGDSILFSPGFSSRGMFPDAHTRSEAFATLVRNL